MGNSNDVVVLLMEDVFLESEWLMDSKLEGDQSEKLVVEVEVFRFKIEFEEDLEFIYLLFGEEENEFGVVEEENDVDVRIQFEFVVYVVKFLVELRGAGILVEVVIALFVGDQFEVDLLGLFDGEWMIICVVSGEVEKGVQQLSLGSMVVSKLDEVW